MKIATETIGGQKIDIDVDGAGVFRATYEEEEYRGESLKAVKDKLIEAAKQVQIERAVPVSVLDWIPTKEKSRYGKTEPFEQGTGVVHATLRGQHARLKSWLLSGPEGQKFRLSTYDHSWIAHRLAEAEVSEYHALKDAIKVAEDAYQAFLDRVLIDPRAALDGEMKPVSRKRRS